MRLKMTQIVTGQFEFSDGRSSFMIIGLSDSGSVYRYEKNKNGWVPLSMEMKPQYDKGEPHVGW